MKNPGTPYRLEMRADSLSSMLRLLDSIAQAQSFWSIGLVARGMWDPPRSGIESMSPVLTGRFFTTEPQGKPKILAFLEW